MADILSNPKNTKELILETSFSFYKTLASREFSLNKLAEKVGISKPAIYRHFKNKEEILEKMQEKFFDDFARYIEPLIKNPIDLDKSVNIIQFFLDNVDYVNYFLNQIMSKKNYEKTIKDELKKRNLTISNHEFAQEKDNCGFTINKKIVFKNAYAGITTLCVIKKLENQGKKISEINTKEIAEKIVHLMLYGFKEVVSEESFFYPNKVSEERIDELDEICKLNDDVFPKESKFFVALAKVINEYRFTGITIERLASELNMAKSSLYEYFKNKNELIRKLITKELMLLQTIITENSIKANNFSEYIYIHLRSEFEYLKKRSLIIPICGWLLIDDDSWITEDEITFENYWSRKIPNVKDENTGLIFDEKTFEGWMWCLPIGLVHQGLENNFTEDDFDKAIRFIFKSIQYGLKELLDIAIN